jgi:hypothetical protein
VKVQIYKHFSNVFLGQLNLFSTIAKMNKVQHYAQGDNVRLSIKRVDWRNARPRLERG